MAIKHQATDDRFLIRALKSEMDYQCRFALMAYSDLDAGLHALMNHSPTLPLRDEPDRIWYSLQGFLVACANISKLLQAVARSRTEHGATLRTQLGVKSDSPLASRELRNHFEHIDERLEQWARSSERQNLAFRCIGPPGMISGLDPGDNFAMLDPISYRVTFRDDTFDLRPMAAEVRELHQKLTAVLLSW